MKKLMLVLTMGALVASGAFAQLTVGLSGVQYFEDDNVGVRQAFENLQDGEGVYYGGFVEIIGRRMGLGLSVNFDPLDYMGVPELEMMSYDVNLYLSYHFFGGRAFLDPFLHFGLGMVGFNFSDPEAAKDYFVTTQGGYYTYVDEDDPMFASMYWNLGLGLGVNLGPLGVFAMAAYNKPINDAVTGTYDDDAVFYGLPSGSEYNIPEWIVSEFTWTFGAKLIL